MPRMRRALPAALVFLFACGGNSGGDDAADFDHLEVEPAFATLTVALGTTGTQAYVVYGVNGTKKTDITSRCALAIDPEFGEFAGATAKVYAHGGKTTIAATCTTLTGQASLAVNLTGQVVVGTNTPPNAPDVFGNATLGSDATRSPRIEYPIDKAVSPRNIPSIEFQWTAAGNDLFHVALRSTFASVDVYTSDLEALMKAADWDSLIGSAAGENLGIVVEGLAQATPATKYASASTSLVVTHDNIDKTAIYYWASNQGNIMSQTFGLPDPPSLVKDDCTSCHSVSRNGARIGYSRCVAGDCNQLYAGFMKYDPMTQSWAETVNANSKAIQGSYTTFSPIGNPFPTDDQSLAIVSLSNGSLALYDPDTGAAVASNLAVANANGTRSALMPDWSADGNKVVFTSTPTPGQWIDLDGGRIATMTYTYQAGTHVFGDPVVIVPNPIMLAGGTYQNFFFPSFSPDGNLVVFNAARTGWRNFTDARTAGQRLMLADAAGAWVTDLTQMNGGSGDLDITWAHWAPTVSNEYYWVVFSSERDYGHRTTAATSPPTCKQNGVTQCKQIWLGAIAKSKLGGTQDPSAPPMWLPGQNPLADNISPYWSVPTKLQ